MDRHFMNRLFARRWLVMLLTALMMAGGIGAVVPTDAAAGQAGTIVTDGAPLFVDHDDYTVLEWMDEGTRVDYFYGPYEWMYEIRYNGTVGWTWMENVSLDGEGGGEAVVAESSSSSSSGGEAWIDIDRSTGAIRLYVGDEVQYLAYGILSQSQGEDYYATASGTYYVYAKNRSLTYTEFANAYITHWIGFDPDRRNGFHSWTKDADGNIRHANGDAYTWGCVEMAPGDADVIYDFAEIGMRVEVHW
jgi:lipoprotein-anchoring transpeptidase ErfK/SrfK